MIRFGLIILTLTAVLQPIISFYYLNNFIEPIIFAFIGLIITILFIVYNNRKKEQHGRLNLIWSILIFLIGLITFQVPTTWIYVADGLIFMKNRETIVSEIKKKNFGQKDIQYIYQGFFPFSINNRLEITKVEKDDLEIKFRTLDLGFLSVHEKGILYRDNPKKIQTYEKATYEAGGVITESSFRVRKIKRNWYFYEYESLIIHD